MTKVFAFAWGFGPIRFAFSQELATLDREEIFKLSSAQCWPLDAIGPIQEWDLAEILASDSINVS